MQISFSTLKNFIDCEAETVAYKKGIWDRSKTFSEIATIAMHNGTLVHTFFEGEEQYSELLKNEESTYIEGGFFKEEYKAGLDMIERLNKSDLFKLVYQGEKEPEIKGSIDGVDFHGFIDCLNAEKNVFCDIKTVNRSLSQKVWNEKTRKKEHWVINRKYHYQMAIYQELLNQQGKMNFTPIICAVSKEEYNDCEIFYIPQWILDNALHEVKKHIKRFKEVFFLGTEPKRCENCNYCKHTKVNKRIKNLEEFI